MRDELQRRCATLVTRAPIVVDRRREISFSECIRNKGYGLLLVSPRCVVYSLSHARRSQKYFLDRSSRAIEASSNGARHAPACFIAAHAKQRHLYKLPTSIVRQRGFCTDYRLQSCGCLTTATLANEERYLLHTSQGGGHGCGFFGTGACRRMRDESIAFAVEVEWEYLCALPESSSELRCLLPEA